MIKIKFKRNKLAVVVIVLSVTFLFLVGLSVKIQNGTFLESGVFTSVQGVIYKSTNGVTDWFSFVTHFSQIKQENEDLKSQNLTMKKKAAEYDALNEKFTTLSQLLKFEDQRSEYDYINCNVIGKGSGDSEDSFLIDKGTKDGIKIDLAVITQQGLVGKVISVYNGYSVVGTLNNANIQVGAMNQRSRDNSGIVTGYEDDSNNKLAMLNGLPQNADIKKGDQIITYGTLYPKDIPIGEVISVGKDPTTVSTNAVIKPYADFTKLEEVSVVKPKNSDLSEIKY
jgi:rod shape-determining protein MreC